MKTPKTWKHLYNSRSRGNEKLKKLSLFIYVLIIGLAMSTNLLATDYMVSGAGSTEVNGSYTTDGTNDDGNPRWKLSGGSYYLHSDGYQWVINDYPNYAFMGFYRNNSGNFDTFLLVV